MKTLWKLLVCFMLCCVVCGCELCDGVEEYEKWDEGVIPYKFISDFTAYEKNMIYGSMQAWTANTAIQFQESANTKNLNYIVKISKVEDDFSSSTIGKKFNSYLKISKKVFTYDSDARIQKYIKHEFAHILGLLHTHCRPDRDDYIEIIYENILPEYYGEFKKEKSNLYDYKKYPYDFLSITHYDSWAFSKNYKKTIIRKDSTLPIYFQTEISEIDSEIVKSIYE